VTSTGLTLVMVPATFTWVDDLERWIGRKIGHRWINTASVAVAGASDSRDLPHGPLPDAAT
jgi:hypothetical protein